MNILQINASAKTSGSTSTRLADSITARLQALHPDAAVAVRTLAQQPVTPLDETAVQARFLPAEQRSAAQSARMAEDDAVVAEFIAADIIVIAAPMYNFNIPAQLQHWIDAIVRPGATFRYTPTGPVGLVAGKTVYVALTSGGAHRGTVADIPARYLTHILGFLGITDVHTVYAENMSRGPELVSQAFAQADAEIMGIAA